MTGLHPRALAALVALGLLVPSTSALSGPVLVYREGAQFCPHDRAPGSPRIDDRHAVERAKALLPAEFCAPSRFVSGCDYEPEFALDSWRVFARQYKLVGGQKRFGGLDHSYVVLDPIGNCIANIPGT